MVWKANNVSIENLTACNFLGGSGDAGNEIWWNGGDGIGQDRPHGLLGPLPDGHLDLLRRQTPAAALQVSEPTAAQYGIFSSNSAGPASWNQLYASNFNDSGMYVGACHQVCGITIDHAWMEYSALGYSGTNSGGADRDRELAVRQQQGRGRHQHADRRRPARAAGRRLPGQRASARSPTPTRAGSSCTTRSTTTTIPNVPAGRDAPAPGPPGPG